MESNPTYKSGYAAIIGKPNVGKSTLLNQLVTVKLAATADKPQTTRNKITGVCHFPGGQIVLLDTPGLHESEAKLNRLMQKTALGTLNDVDIILFVVDAERGFAAEDEWALGLTAKAKPPKVLVLNKTDLTPKLQLLPLIDTLRQKAAFRAITPVSALTRDGLDVLARVILDLLPEGPVYFPENMVTDCPQHFLIGEIIREKTIRLTHMELPHAIAIAVEDIKEGHKGETVIHASIYVEKASQRKILIGTNGSLIKKIGGMARTGIEKLCGNKVYLDLHVKVKEKWRNNDLYLRELGYQ